MTYPDTGHCGKTPQNRYVHVSSKQAPGPSSEDARTQCKQAHRKRYLKIARHVRREDVEN